MFRAGTCLLLMLLLFTTTAFAQQKSSFVVLPFTVEGPQGYAYLERSVPQMLTSRLYAKDAVEPVAKEVPASQKAVADEKTAEKLRASYGADYVIWGTVTVVGDTCSLDVRIRNKAGKVWHQSGEAPANQFISAIKTVSDRINKDVFKQSPAVASGAGKGRTNQMNRDLVMNQTTPSEVYLNPQFRYAGSSTEDDSRLRSQAMPYVSVGMEICDANGDGKNEIFILSDTNMVYAYTFGNGKLNQIAEYKLPKTGEPFTIRSIPSATGLSKLVINYVDVDGKPKGRILNFIGTNFTEDAIDIPMFLNVVKLPPHYSPVLIGQKHRAPRIFDGGVYELIKSGNQYIPGTKLNLPEGVNVLNFSYLPGSRNEPNSDKLIALTSLEHLRVYNHKNTSLAETEESYSGSSKGIAIGTEMPGLGKDKVTIKDMFYAPLRMLAVDFERDGKYELIVNRPTSTASKVFDRYRFFPQSELQSLYWDGLGLNLQWKTRRIKGSIADFALADANNDGIVDLVGCINTHPGALGTKARKTMIVVYPLDLTLSGSGQQPHRSFADDENN